MYGTHNINRSRYLLPKTGNLILFWTSLQWGFPNSWRICWNTSAFSTLSWKNPIGLTNCILTKSTVCTLRWSEYVSCATQVVQVYNYHYAIIFRMGFSQMCPLNAKLANQMAHSFLGAYVNFTFPCGLSSLSWEGIYMSAPPWQTWIHMSSGDGIRVLLWLYMVLFNLVNLTSVSHTTWVPGAESMAKQTSCPEKSPPNFGSLLPWPFI